jgi:hypothetical protein
MRVKRRQAQPDLQPPTSFDRRLPAGYHAPAFRYAFGVRRGHKHSTNRERTNMSTLGMILNLIGGLIGLAGGIWLIVVAFKESILWGILCFIPCVNIIFALTHWEKAKKPFLVLLVGAALASVGSYLTRGAAA